MTEAIFSSTIEVAGIIINRKTDFPRCFVAHSASLEVDKLSESADLACKSPEDPCQTDIFFVADCLLFSQAERADNPDHSISLMEREEAAAEASRQDGKTGCCPHWRYSLNTL